MPKAELQQYRQSAIDQAEQVANLSQLKLNIGYKVDGSHDFLDNTGDLPGCIRHFDTHWSEEKLPKDWYNLKKRAGFSMDTQMQLLKDLDSSSVKLWAEQTKQDMLGFCLEYLSNGLVFPIRYEKRRKIGGFELYDPQYKKAMLAGASPKERNGQVVESLSRIESFFLNSKTPDGSIAVMPSPKGETGLTTDDGAPITYPDSYWYVMVKLGSEIRGFTIKTDFSLLECKAAIKNLTGREIPIDAPIEDYVSALSFLRKDEENPVGIEDVINILRQSRIGKSDLAFKNRSWDEVIMDIHRGYELYSFNKETQKILQEFSDYTRYGSHSVLELRKALAATMLRLSKLFLFDRKSQPANADVYFENDYRRIGIIDPSFGSILDEMGNIPGCAGGGSKKRESSELVFSVVPRVGKVERNKLGEDDDEEESYSFNIPGICGGKSAEGKNDSVPCGQQAMLGPCGICESCDKKIRAQNSSRAA